MRSASPIRSETASAHWRAPAQQPPPDQRHECDAHCIGQQVQPVSLPPTGGRLGKLDATALADTNQLEIRVYANEATRQAVAIARLDNLGKGASGAAVQNLQLMLGL